MRLETLIEAVLFYKTEPATKKELAKLLAVSEEDIENVLPTLATRLTFGATRLIDTGDTLQLVSAPEVADIIEKLRKEELAREIGKAGAETLAIILYRGPVSRAQIDFIRGVNSAFILRNLQIRGLVERREHKTQNTAFQYVATPALYAYLGVTQKESLPQYTSIMREITTFEQTASADVQETNSAATSHV